MKLWLSLRWGEGREIQEQLRRIKKNKKLRQNRKRNNKRNTAEERKKKKDKLGDEATVDDGEDGKKDGGTDGKEKGGGTEENDCDWLDEEEDDVLIGLIGC